MEVSRLISFDRKMLWLRIGTVRNCGAVAWMQTAELYRKLESDLFRRLDRCYEWHVFSVVILRVWSWIEMEIYSMVSRLVINLIIIGLMFNDTARIQ